jgi:transcriptional regulator with XRE-family HTH domain
MSDLKMIGRRVQKLRMSQTSLTQTDLATAVGVSWPTISRLERGVGRRLDIDRLHDVARALGVTVEELLNGDKAAVA